jgi:uncharacterized protein (TIGR03435 family)
MYGRRQVLQCDWARMVWRGAIFAAVAFGQTPAPTPRRFEVASIKPNKSGPPTGAWTSPIATLPGGRFTATNVTLVDVIVQVYHTRRIQMQGGPGWIDSERFDIVAKADATEGDVTRDQWPLMIQALLEDRFKLTYHRETKDMPVLALVGKLPAAFRESKDGTPTSVPGDRGKLTFRHWPVNGLVNLSANILRTPVVDATGIEGFYDYSLDPMQFAAADNAAGPAPTYADLFETALREQLGFRLEKRKAPLEIMVIDQASRPTEN